MSPKQVSLSNRMHELVESLGKDAPAIFGTPRPQIIVRDVQRREASEVARAEVGTETGSVVVFAKIFNPRPREDGFSLTRERFQKDCGITQRVFAAMQSCPDLRAVEIVARYDGLLGVVTKQAEGVRLDSMIRQHAAWPAVPQRLRQVEIALERTGRWVAAFQRIAAEPSGRRISLAAMREYIDVRLRRLVELPRAGVTEKDREELLAWVDDRSAAVAERDLDEVAVHGDIVPSNVIAAPDRVTVLDFGMTGFGCRYLDIARMFSQLEFFRAKPQFRDEVINRLNTAALRGFDPGLSVRNPLFELCVVQHVVCHLLSHTRQPGRFPANLYSAHLRRRHRNWLRERAQGRTATGAD